MIREEYQWSCALHSPMPVSKREEAFTQVKDLGVNLFFPAAVVNKIFLSQEISCCRRSLRTEDIT